MFTFHAIIGYYTRFGSSPCVKLHAFFPLVAIICEKMFIFAPKLLEYENGFITREII